MERAGIKPASTVQENNPTTVGSPFGSKVASWESAALITWRPLQRGWRRRDLHQQLRAYPDNTTRSVRSPKQGSALGIHGALIVKRLLRKDGQVDGVGKGFHPVSLQITITDGRSAQKYWARNRIRPTSRRRLSKARRRTDPAGSITSPAPRLQNGWPCGTRTRAKPL